VSLCLWKPWEGDGMFVRPKHGNWLNIAEIELSAMTSQCLDRRIDTLEKLSSELDVRQHEWNTNLKTVNCHSTVFCRDRFPLLPGRLYQLFVHTALCAIWVKLRNASF
jgi:hypothetical protein